jgi:hypothetical protein
MGRFFVHSVLFKKSLTGVLSSVDVFSFLDSKDSFGAFLRRWSTDRVLIALGQRLWERAQGGLRSETV